MVEELDLQWEAFSITKTRQWVLQDLYLQFDEQGECSTWQAIYTGREAEQLRTFLRKCFMDTSQFLQLSHVNLLILVKGLSPQGLQFPGSSGSAVPHELPGVGNLRYPGLWALVVALLLQSEQLLVQSCSLYVCRNSQEPGSSGTGPSDLLPHLGLAFVLLRPTCLAPFALCTLLLLLGCPVQHLTFKLCAPANRKSAGLTFIFAVCIWLPARRCFWLCGWHWLDHGT